MDPMEVHGRRRDEQVTTGQRRKLRRAERKSRPAGAGRLFPLRGDRLELLLHHAFDQVADDGQLELFALVGLVHAENEYGQVCQADDWE